MLIYEKVVSGVRKLFGTQGTAPAENDSEVLVDGATFDFAPGKYFYKAPGGIMTKDGEEVSVTLNGTPIIPASDTAYDEIEELIDDKGTADTSDDKLKKEFTEDELKEMTKSTIFEMAQLLGYSGVEMSMTKTAMIEAFLTAQSSDTRKESGGK